MVQTQQMQDRGMKVMHGGNILDRPVTKFVRRTIRKGCLDSRARQSAGETCRVVIPTRGADLEGRHATKLAAENHQRVLQHAALAKVGQ